MTMKIGILLFLVSSSLSTRIITSSSESDSFEENVRRPLPQHQKRIGPANLDTNPPGRKINDFFVRPKSYELKKYDDRVRSERPQPELFDRPTSEELDDYDKKVKISQISPVKEKTLQMDDSDEKLMLETIGRFVLAEDSDESNSYEHEDSVIFIPLSGDNSEKPTIQSNNNNNRNVLVKVNNYDVKTKVFGNNEKSGEESLPPVPVINDTHFLYLHLNLIDFLVVSLILAFIITVVKKTYKKCFVAKKSCSSFSPSPPPLPTTPAPPHYAEPVKQLPV